VGGKIAAGRRAPAAGGQLRRVGLRPKGVLSSVVCFLSSQPLTPSRQPRIPSSAVGLSLPTAYCLLLTAFCLLLSVLPCLLPVYCLRSSFYGLPSVICIQPSAYCFLLTAFRSLPSPVHSHIILCDNRRRSILTLQEARSWISARPRPASRFFRCDFG